MREQARIIFLAGPPGAGKSTVAKLLVAAMDAPVAYIEGDIFLHFFVKSGHDAPQADQRTQDFRIAIQAMTASAARYARGGYDTVVDFPIGAQAIELIRKKVTESLIDYVVLCPSESVCAARAAARSEGTMPDYAPYREVHQMFAMPGKLEKHVIRSDSASAKELAAQIQAGLIAGAFRL